MTDICKTVTGVIEESSTNEDGDHHMLLKLDAGQEDLLTKKNTKKKQGDLVIEAVCANKTTLGKVGNTCNGYINKIQIPKLGEHVKVTGSLVIDTHNGWAEIHPITKIEIVNIQSNENIFKMGFCPWLSWLCNLVRCSYSGGQSAFLCRESRHRFNHDWFANSHL